MTKNPTTSAEALQAQALEDIDSLLTRLEKLDASLSKDIADATNKVMMAARLNFEESLNKQRLELLKAGKIASEEIAASLQDNIVGIQQVSVSIGLQLLYAIIAGIVGGVTVYALHSFLLAT